MQNHSDLHPACRICGGSDAYMGGKCIRGMFRRKGKIGSFLSAGMVDSLKHLIFVG